MQTINHAVIAIQSVSLTPAPTLSLGVSAPRRIHQPLPSLGTRSRSGGDRPHRLGGTWAAVTSAVTPLPPRFGVAAAPLPDPAAERHRGPDPCRGWRSCVPRQQPLIRAGIYAARWALLNGKNSPRN